MNVIDKIDSEQLKEKAPEFNVGDTVKVSVRVVEGNKERIQVFSGIVIARKGKGVNECFTVRRISYGEGVERVFPLHSPRLDKIVVDKTAAPRRAKLYYLRDRKGAMTVRQSKSPKARTKNK